MLKQSQMPQAKQRYRGKHFNPGHHPRKDTHNNFQAPPQQILFSLVLSTNKIKEREEFNVQLGYLSRISLKCLVHHKLLLKANVYYSLLCARLKRHSRQQIPALLCTVPTANFFLQPSLPSSSISNLCRFYI